jgi:hypothetical protein
MTVVVAFSRRWRNFFTASMLNGPVTAYSVKREELFRGSNSSTA